MSSLFDIFDCNADVNSPLSADLEGFELNIIGYDLGSVQVVWTGADATDAKIVPQASNDGLNWCNLKSEASSTTIDAVSGCAFYQFTEIGYKWFRVKIIANSNTMGVFNSYYIFKRRRN